jgi:hypothetical protein
VIVRLDTDLLFVLINDASLLIERFLEFGVKCDESLLVCFLELFGTGPDNVFLQGEGIRDFVSLFLNLHINIFLHRYEALLILLVQVKQGLDRRLYHSGVILPLLLVCEVNKTVSLVIWVL